MRAHDGSLHIAEDLGKMGKNTSWGGLGPMVPML